MVSCGVGCRCGSDLVVLWLWRRLAATAPIGRLAWEPPYAVGVAIKSKQTNKKPHHGPQLLLSNTHQTGLRYLDVTLFWFDPFIDYTYFHLGGLRCRFE